MKTNPDHTVNGNSYYSDGIIPLTKREYFAVIAMKALINNGEDLSLNEFPKKLAYDSVLIADYLIQELNKTN